MLTSGRLYVNIEACGIQGNGMKPGSLTETIVQKLSEADLGYGAGARQGKDGARWRDAGVLALLRRLPGEDEGPSGYAFVLNKRSADVSQPGDLCFPGGHPRALADRFIARVLMPLTPSIGGSRAFRLAGKRDPATFATLRLYLACALRETYEEMRLPPARVEFLGPLPASRMATRRRVIHPFAGLVAAGTPLRTGPEVERNVLLPLPELFLPENYGTYALALTGQFAAAFGSAAVEVPCFRVREPEGPGEILWGATFRIIMGFLREVFGFTPPENGPVRANAVLYPERAAGGRS